MTLSVSRENPAVAQNSCRSLDERAALTLVSTWDDAEVKIMKLGIISRHWGAFTILTSLCFKLSAQSPAERLSGGFYEHSGYPNHVRLRCAILIKPSVHPRFSPANAQWLPIKSAEVRSLHSVLSLYVHRERKC